MYDIERIRKEKKLTQEELAERVGVSRVTVGHWERGETKPSKSKMKRLREVLDCSSEETGMSESEIKVRLSRILSGSVTDASTENLFREIIFTSDLDWQMVWNMIKFHKPEEWNYEKRKGELQ